MHEWDSLLYAKQKTTLLRCNILTVKLSIALNYYAQLERCSFDYLRLLIHYFEFMQRRLRSITFHYNKKFPGQMSFNIPIIIETNSILSMHVRFLVSSTIQIFFVLCKSKHTQKKKKSKTLIQLDTQGKLRKIVRMLKSKKTKTDWN